MQQDYQQFYDAFNVHQLDSDFSGNLDKGINACVECCDRFAESGGVAVRFVDEILAVNEVSFAELRDRAAQFANFLTDNGVGPGDRVAGLLPRIPELFTVILGTLRAGAVYQPLFTAFGPKAIEHRVKVSDAKIIVTDPVNRRKLTDSQSNAKIVTIGASDAGDFDFASEIGKRASEFEPVLRRRDDLFLMMFTSGTTGPAKAVGVPISALSAFKAYMSYGLDLRPEDVFWNIADPGWAYGLYYAVIGPLLLGQATTIFEGAFDVSSTVRLVQKLKITNFAGAPTAYRMLIADPSGEVASLKGYLRVASSAGEPLNPEVMQWFSDNLEVNLFDQYGQTEIGMVLANHHGLAHQVRPGSAGRPMPGFTLAVTDKHGTPQPDGTSGILAVNRKASPLLFFTDYWDSESSATANDYYLTGDIVERAPEGFYTFGWSG